MCTSASCGGSVAMRPGNTVQSQTSDPELSLTIQSPVSLHSPEAQGSIANHHANC